MIDGQTEAVCVLQIFQFVAVPVPDVIIPCIDHLCTVAQTNPIYIAMICGILGSVALANEVKGI